MKIGILGTGFGCYHLEQYKQMKEVEQIVIWGRNEEKLNEIEDHFVSEKEKNTDIKYTIITTNDINTILMDDQIELVDVCLPNELHNDYVLKAMKSGKNVICEVPVMLSVNDLNEIIEYKKNSKVKCFADLFERFEFANEFLKNTVVNKEYGALRSIRVYRNTPPWWGSLGKKNIVFHLMIHEIDYIGWLLGFTNHITVNSTFVNEDKGIVNIDLSYDNIIAQITSSSMMPGQYPFSVGYEAIFDEAVIRYTDEGYADHEDMTLKVITGKETKNISIPDRNSYYQSLETAVNAISSQCSSINEIEEAENTIKLAEQINEQLV